MSVIDDIFAILNWGGVLEDVTPELEASALAGASDVLLTAQADHTMIASANAGASKWAAENAAELIVGLDQTTKDKLRDILANALSEETDREDLIQEIQDSGVFSNARAEMIARTEVNDAQIAGNLEAWKEMGNVDLLDWTTANDDEVCDDCLGLEDGGPYTIAEYEELDSHPNCRCAPVPYIAEKVAKMDKGELGTRATGFSNSGPFSCMNCIWRTPHSSDENGEEVDSCSHPLVMKDPELQDIKLPDGTIPVDWDDCCRYVRPEES